MSDLLAQVPLKSMSLCVKTYLVQKCARLWTLNGVLPSMVSLCINEVGHTLAYMLLRDECFSIVHLISLAQKLDLEYKACYRVDPCLTNGNSKIIC